MNVKFNVDLSNYTEKYNYLYASIYDATGIKTKNKGEFTYQNIDFDTLPNGFSVKKSVKVGEKLDLTINNVPVGLNAIVVVELVNIVGNTSTVVYGGISDVFTIENSSNHKIKLGNLNLSNSGGSSAPVSKKVYITFDSNGGSGEMLKQEFTVGTVSVLNQNVFTNDGYKFLKWNTESDGSGIDYFDCANVKIERDLTLYAIWVTEEEVIYKIEHYKQNLNNDNYTLFESEYKTGMESDKLTQSAKNYVGYNFANVVLSNEGTLVKVYYDCILFTVTFEFNDETINFDNTQVAKYGATIQKPEISSENKYFYGWYTDENFANVFDFATVVTEDITLYAKWIDLTTASYEATASDVGTVIGNLSGEGPHYVKVTGAITNSTISTIRTKLKNKSSCLVVLDLSETTGLTKLDEYHDSSAHNSTIYASCSSSYCYKYNFNGCSNLVEIILPDTLTKIGDFSFYGCINLKSIVIPEGITTIGKEAFFGCKKLDKIEIPESVTSIGEKAFSGCKFLSIKLPNSISSLPISVDQAENVIINDDNPYFVWENGFLLSRDKKTVYLCRTDDINIVVPETVELICEDVFANNDRIKSVKLLNPNTVTVTTNFNNCSNLESVEATGNFVGSTFKNCYKLKSVIGIGDSELPSFSYCQDLEIIYIKSKISEISSGCFFCTNKFCEIEFENRPKKYTSEYSHYDAGTGRITIHNGPSGSVTESTDITALIKGYTYSDDSYWFTFTY